MSSSSPSSSAGIVLLAGLNVKWLPVREGVLRGVVGLELTDIVGKVVGDEGDNDESWMVGKLVRPVECCLVRVAGEGDLED
jgi:hypothetical protein